MQICEKFNEFGKYVFPESAKFFLSLEIIILKLNSIKLIKSINKGGSRLILNRLTKRTKPKTVGLCSADGPPTKVRKIGLSFDPKPMIF